MFDRQSLWLQILSRQSLWLHLININDYATFYRNIAYSSWVKISKIFSDFETRQSLGCWQIAFSNFFGLGLVNINMYANFYQNTCIIQELGPDSFFSFLILPRPSLDQIRRNCMKNDIWKEFKLYLVNINVYANCKISNRSSGHTFIKMKIL